MTRRLMLGALLFTFGAAGAAGAQSVTVFDSLPAVLPPNVPGIGFQCCAISEIGDEIRLAAATSGRAASATVLMSSWALRADYPQLPAGGYAHPITLNIYADDASAMAHAPMLSLTQSFTIPWRPAADPACANGGWRSTDGLCYSGLAFGLVFDLRALNAVLPSHFIYGVAFNTGASGYQPVGVPGPYDSLNVGLSVVDAVPLPPSIGEDVDGDVVYWNTAFGEWYADGGAGGAGTFRADTGWAGFPIGVRFDTTLAVALSKDDCKDGGWRDLVRADGSPFANQGVCVSYVSTPPR